MSFEVYRYNIVDYVSDIPLTVYFYFFFFWKDVLYIHSTTTMTDT